MKKSILNNDSNMGSAVVSDTLDPTESNRALALLAFPEPFWQPLPAPINNTPVVQDDYYTTRAGQTLAIAAPGLLANDYDPDGDALSVTSIDITGLQGSVSAFTDGHFNFTPSVGFSGLTSFSYNISDGFGGVASGTVRIDVANGTPWANSDYYTTRPGQTLAIAAPGLLANDYDPDGDPLSVTSIDITGLQGSVSAFTDGHFNFTPSAGFSGLTSFSYNISDGFGGVASGTVRIDVANGTPWASDDYYTTRAGQTLAIAAPGLLANDYDPDGDALSVTSIDITGLQGSVSAFTDGHFNFTPSAGFSGLTSFSYNISDGFGGVASGTVRIDVANGTPWAMPDHYTTRPGQTLAIAAPGLLANDYDPDGDPLSVTSIDITGLQGSVSAFTDGHFNFTPSAGFSGFTSFGYNISDGFGGVASGTVRIDVANGTPWASDDYYTTRAGQTLAIAAPGLLANDYDPDGDALSVTSIDITGLQGSVSAFADGHFNFTPSAGFSGFTSFSYNISDGFGGVATGTVGINVANGTPWAMDDHYTTRPGQTLAIAAPGLLANDNDPDGDALSVTSIDITGLQGSVTAFTDGHFNFTPSAGFSGFTSFSYNISDGFGGVATGTVGINVANGTPWAMDDHYTTRPGQTLAIAAPGLLANDNDPDGDALSVTSIDITGLQGSVTAFADGHFNFTPSAGFSGLTSFSYNISDGFGGTGTATAIIDVAPLLTVTRSIGDAPERQSGAGGQWAAAWTNSAIVSAITHKADVTNIGESWSAVRLSGLSPQTLAGGDIFNGDLGVSAQSVASSSVRQEIDGREGLRLDLAEAAAGLTVYLSRLFAQDDGGSFFESGRVRLLDAAGLVVKEGVFHAANLTGRQTLTLDSDIAFSTVEITAGVYNAAGSFVHGGYALADGSFASEVSIDALGGKHGSDFLIDKIDFQVPVAGVPLEVFLA